jgi:psp operon transcriptional activator
MSLPAPETLVGSSEAFLDVLERVSRVAPLRRPVLLIGERGTGKELIAARLHYLSERWERPYLALNCAALNDELLESELFGHTAGAFTGAAKARVGRFETADGGTLFLDELASMSLRLQEKILRVIEYGQFERVGESRTQSVDVRLIGAANVDLPSMAREGKFREDLLDRLSFDVITLPPLRERREDILLLAQKFAEGMAAELGRELFAGFTSAALTALREYRWPGNVRELRNVVERAVYRLEHPDDRIDRLEFDPFASPYRPQAAAAAAPDRPREEDPDLPFETAVRAFEVRRLREALDACQFNQRRAAEKLGLSYHQLRGHLRKYPEILAGRSS